MKYIRWLLIAVILLSTSSCTQRARTPIMIPEWGRASQVGTTSRAKQVDLAISADGTMVMMAWPARLDSGQDYIHLYILNDDGSVQYDANLQPPVPGVNQIKLVSDASGGVHLNMTTSSQNGRILWSAALPSIPYKEDLISISPTPISQPDSSVVWFEVHSWGLEDYVTIWLDDEDNAYLKHGNGSIRYNVLQNVAALDASLNAEGNLELVWASESAENRMDINIASLDSENIQVGTPMSVTSIRLGRGNNAAYVEDLVISIQGDQRTLSWTQPYDYGGRSARQLATATLTGHESGIEQAHSVSVYPLTRSMPPELILDSTMNMHLVRPAYNSASETNVRSASSSTSIPNVGVVLATAVQYTTRTRVEYQPTLIYFDRQGFIGHQPLTWTDHSSMYPIVGSDKMGYLYAAWIDNIGVGFHYPVYLATTSPGLQGTFKHLSLDDYVVIGWDWLNRVVLGIVLLPFIVQWFLFPICYLVLLLIRGDRYGRRGASALLGGLFLYWASKYLITSQVLTLLPDLRITQHATRLLTPHLIPILTLIVSILGEAVYRRIAHRWDDGLFSRFMRISLPDAAVSMIIYAIGSFS